MAQESDAQMSCASVTFKTGDTLRMAHCSGSDWVELSRTSRLRACEQRAAQPFSESRGVEVWNKANREAPSGCLVPKKLH